MKLKSIFVSALAVIAMAVACAPEEIISSIDGLEVSNDYVTLAAGEDAAVTGILTVTAAQNWTASVIDSRATWLSVSPASGTAGSTVTLTLTAQVNTTSERTAEVAIDLGVAKKLIKVIQAAPKGVDAPESTCKDVLEGESDKTYKITGVITKISNNHYGNMYVNDGTIEGDGIYIYGTNDRKGNKNNSSNAWDNFNDASYENSWNIAVGDVVTVQGPKTVYNGTVELVDVDIIKLTPSLIDVAEFDFEKLPCIDTTFNMVISSKESPLLVKSDSDWLQIVGVSADGSYKLHANENPRTAERTATVSIQGPTALKTVSITQSGIPASGATVSEIIEMEDGSAVLTLQSTTVVAKSTRGVVVTDGSKYLYIFGDKTADVQVGDNVQVAATKTTYGGIPELTEVESVVVDSQGNPVNHPDPKDITSNAVEYKSAVTEYVKLSGTLKVSGNYYNLALDGIDESVKMGSVSYPIADLNIKSYEGKKITVTGYFTGLTSTGGRFINIVATKIAEYTENPKGTLTNPYTPSEIATLLTAGTAVEGNVYVKGKVSAILYTFSANFGTGTFWISDDGIAYGVSDDKKKTSQPTKDFECYGVYWFNNTPWAEGNAQVAIGDEVVVCGKVTVYNGIAETSNKNAWVYSVNGSTTDANGVGNAAFPFNVAGACSFIEYMEEAKAAAAAADQPAPSFPDVCVKGKVSAILYTFSASYGTGTFWISDDGTAYGVSDDKKKTSQPTKDFECYGVYWFNNTPWAEGNAQIAVGDDVIVRGQLTKYNGIYETSNKKAWVYSLNGNTE